MSLQGKSKKYCKGKGKNMTMIQLIILSVAFSALGILIHLSANVNPFSVDDLVLSIFSFIIMGALCFVFLKVI